MRKRLLLKGGVATGINRYIMECKLPRAAMTLSVRKELIDTLWNVNL